MLGRAHEPRDTIETGRRPGLGTSAPEGSEFLGVATRAGPGWATALPWLGTEGGISACGERGQGRQVRRHPRSAAADASYLVRRRDMTRKKREEVRPSSREIFVSVAPQRTARGVSHKCRDARVGHRNHREDLR